MMMPTPKAEIFSRLTALQLNLHNARDFQIARLLFERLTFVTRLDIRTVEYSGYTLISAGVGSKVISAVFGSGKAFLRRSKLTHLSLEGMDFSAVGTTLAQVLPFGDLTHLHLYQCQQTDALCESLSRLKMRLQSFSDVCFYNPILVRRRGAVDAFLKSIPPLRQLRMTQTQLGRNGEVESFDWKALATHAPGLRCLDLGDFKLENTIFIDTTRNLPDFLAFCKSASDLQQLSIIGPEIEKTAWSTPHGLFALLVSLSSRAWNFIDISINLLVALSAKHREPTTVEILVYSRLPPWPMAIRQDKR
jgi:hypothetical protein